MWEWRLGSIYVLQTQFSFKGILCLYYSSPVKPKILKSQDTAFKEKTFVSDVKFFLKLSTHILKWFEKNYYWVRILTLVNEIQICYLYIGYL